MPKSAVIDSGPLIALFDKDDAFHGTALDFIRDYKGILYSTVAVLTEVSHLLDFNAKVQLDFLKWVSAGAIELVDIDKEDLERICVLTEKYSNVPMDFADATLVVTAEKINVRHVASIDSDFYVYRTLSNGYLTNLIQLQNI